jgi:hypothetical protein
MKTSTLEKLVWVLIYGGLLVLALGLAVRANSAPIGVGLCLGGGVAAALGLVLIVVRSRIKAP